MQWIEDTPPARLEALLVVARQFVAQRPGDVHGWRLLTQALTDSKLFQEASARLAEAVARFPEDIDLSYRSAVVLEELGDFEAALAALDRTLSLAPDHIGAHLLRCGLAIKTLPPARAMEAVAAVTPLAGSHRAFARLRLRALFRAASAQDLLAQCERDLALRPGDTLTTYMKATALAKLGRAEEARAVISLDRFIEVAMLSAPDGFSGSEAFCRALADEIAGNPAFISDPRGKAPRDAQLTWHVRDTGTPALNTLLRSIKAHLDTYAARLENDADGFARARPERARLSAWAVLSGAEGHQLSHHHPGGWASGVFYVEAPRRTGGAYQGPLVLGALDGSDGTPPWGTREVEPVPGRIVLFPSYLPHTTLPPHADGRRIVVAFDVVPVAAPEASTA